MSEHRYETKVPLQRDQFVELKASLINAGLYPKKVYPDRRVHSIYLDDHEYTDYSDNVAGISRRSKTRIRWYDDETTRLALEVKRKSGKVSDKTVIRIANPDSNIPRDKKDYVQLLRGQEDKLHIAQFAALIPVIEVEYQRGYFELSKDVRMTLDRAIRYRKLYPQPSHRWRQSHVDAVVEFKYPVGRERVFHDLVHGLPFRVFRHSKYVVGMDHVCVG